MFDNGHAKDYCDRFYGGVEGFTENRTTAEVNHLEHLHVPFLNSKLQKLRGPMKYKYPDSA